MRNARGYLIRFGACWINDHAKVCAWIRSSWNLGWRVGGKLRHLLAPETLAGEAILGIKTRCSIARAHGALTR